MEKKYFIILIVGPTGVGKTDISVKIARAFHSEIINADSRQIYRYMDIGTAKPTSEHLSSVRHHLIDIVEPDEYFSAGEYRKRSEEIIQKLLNKGMMPVVVGGSGLYLKALLYGLFEGPEADPNLRKTYDTYADKFGSEALHKKLSKIDPQAAQRIHPKDRVRIIRALEVYEKTGKPISSLQGNFSLQKSLYAPIIIGLQRERKELYQRIEQRVDSMMAEGFVDEVRRLLDRGYSEDLRALMGIGYGQIIHYLKGEYNIERAISLIKRDTKRYAKRQMTWFQKMENINWLTMTDDADNDLKKALDLIRQKLKETGVHDDSVRSETPSQNNSFL